MSLTLSLFTTIMTYKYLLVRLPLAIWSENNYNSEITNLIFNENAKKRKLKQKSRQWYYYKFLLPWYITSVTRKTDNHKSPPGRSSWWNRIDATDPPIGKAVHEVLLPTFCPGRTRLGGKQGRFGPAVSVVPWALPYAVFDQRRPAATDGHSPRTE